MNSISKTILLSAVSLFVDNGNLTYASEQIPLSVPKSGIQTLHTHHTHIRHTLQRLDLSSRLFDDSKISGKEQKVASVCFITDAGNCSGDRFGNTETPGGGNGGGTPNGNDGDDPEYDTIPEQCEDAGYTKTSCPTGQHLVNPCPSDNRYYERCECDNDYSELCNGTDQKGVGKACNGKYKECCNLCSAYPYPSVPAGYVSIGECDSCDGKRYQIKCDNKTYSINSNICGVYGGYGNSCTDDGGTYFRECKCPLNYEWSATALKCVCSSAFKYTCTGTGYARGDGEPCDGKYKACICAEGYSWDAATGKCLLSCANECSLTTCPSPFTCRYEECSKRYCKTGCEAGYDWDASTQTCNSQCSASYKYDESNCPISSNHHCSEPCGGKYKDCKSLPSEVRGFPKTFKTGDITWVSDSVASCPNQELNISEDASPVRLQFGNIYYAECLTGDSACEKLSDFVNDRKSSLFGKTVSYNVTQDMNCGNIIMTRENKVNASGATFLINGNGHTLNFTRTAEASFSDTRTTSSNPAHIVLDNIRIIQKTNSFFANNRSSSCNWYGDDPNVFDTGVTLKSNVYVEAERINTRLGPLIQKSATVKSSVFGFEVGANATLNILPYGTYTNTAMISVNNNSVVNFKNFQCQSCNLQTYYGGALIEVHGSNSIINMCAASESAALQFSFIKNCYPITVNANRDIRINYSNSSASCPNSVTVKIDSSVCSKMNF